MTTPGLGFTPPAITANVSRVLLNPGALQISGLGFGNRDQPTMILRVAPGVVNAGAPVVLPPFLSGFSQISATGGAGYLCAGPSHGTGFWVGYGQRILPDFSSPNPDLQDRNSARSERDVSIDRIHGNNPWAPVYNSNFTETGLLYQGANFSASVDGAQLQSFSIDGQALPTWAVSQDVAREALIRIMLSGGLFCDLDSIKDIITSPRLATFEHKYEFVSLQPDKQASLQLVFKTQNGKVDVETLNVFFVDPTTGPALGRLSGRVQRDYASGKIKFAFRDAKNGSKTIVWIPMDVSDQNWMRGLVFLNEELGRTFYAGDDTFALVSSSCKEVAHK